MVAGINSLAFLTYASSAWGERMRITGSNVGIGTTTPDRQLEVYGTDDGYMKFDGGRTDNHGFTIGSFRIVTGKQ